MIAVALPRGRSRRTTLATSPEVVASVLLTHEAKRPVAECRRRQNGRYREAVPCLPQGDELVNPERRLVDVAWGRRRRTGTTWCVRTGSANRAVEPVRCTTTGANALISVPTP